MFPVSRTKIWPQALMLNISLFNNRELPGKRKDSDNDNLRMYGRREKNRGCCRMDMVHSATAPLVTKPSASMFTPEDMLLMYARTRSFSAPLCIVTLQSSCRPGMN